MDEKISYSISPACKAPVEKIVFVEPKYCMAPSNCEISVNIGLFFDGTRNNRYSDKPARSHTNIARLYDAYRDEPDGGYYAIYLPGVGTSFPEIGEYGEHTSGTAFAVGSESRVLFALLAIFNAIHRSVFSEKDLFSGPQIKAICGYSTLNMDDYSALEEVGLASSLAGEGSGVCLRESALCSFSNELEKKLRSRMVPKIKMCFIDVFGFSRGAAAARVFCQWFTQLLTGKRFAGISVRLRFLGVIETVASAGYSDGILGTITNTTGGHVGWANEKYLPIHPMVENCLHQVAMHELRKNFPLDEVNVDGVLPPRCQEFAYPGAHSDVGGGYEPEGLGVSIGKNLLESDAMKLSQIPLNHMMECAIAAGVPFSRTQAINSDGYDPFTIAPVTQKAFDEFLSITAMTPRMLCDWMQPYLNWRWQVKDNYLTLKQVRQAKLGRDLLLDSNKKLIRDAEFMRYRGEVEKARDFLSRAFNKRKFDVKDLEYRQEEVSALDPEALAVLQKAQQAKPVEPALAEFFDNFVHDSLAGFRKDLVEATGYWRYRRGFRGDAAPTIVSTDRPDSSSKKT